MLLMESWEIIILTGVVLEVLTEYLNKNFLRGKDYPSKLSL